MSKTTAIKARTLQVGLATIVMVSLSATSFANQAPDPIGPDLTGTWQLDFQQTQGSPADRPTYSPTGPAERLAAERIRERMDAQRTLEIFQQGAELTINATGSDFVVFTNTIHPDGKTQRTELGNDFDSKAEWNERTLVVETNTPGGKRIETYELLSGGARLLVTTKIEDDRLPLSIFFKRTYRRRVNDWPVLSKQRD